MYTFSPIYNISVFCFSVTLSLSFLAHCKFKCIMNIVTRYLRSQPIQRHVAR
jgi:hypothetical protein